MSDHMEDLHKERDRGYKEVVALSKRLEEVSVVVRKQHRQQASSVSGGVHAALIAAACVLLAWPDVTLAQRYITGFKSVGTLEWTGVLRGMPVGR